jgi:predicted N-formylglutamate amidohydrolase
LSDFVIVTCEHGGNRVPREYRPMFHDLASLLPTHRGYDAGALRMASDLAASLDAPLVAATVTRLLVDLNRSVGHRRLHHETVADMDVEHRRQIVERYYLPYRRAVERLVAGKSGTGRCVLHLSSHSFTPVLDGETRTADVGLLYDPRRRGEVTFCEAWKKALSTVAPELRVRRNYPYEGRNDGLTSALRKRYGPGTYVGIELEINQAQIIGAGRRWPRVRSAVVQSLHLALDSWRRRTA